MAIFLQELKLAVAATTHLMLAAVMKTRVSIDNFPVHSNLVGFHCNNTAADDGDHAPKNQLEAFRLVGCHPTERVISSHTF